MNTTNENQQNPAPQPEDIVEYPLLRVAGQLSHLVDDVHYEHSAPAPEPIVTGTLRVRTDSDSDSSTSSDSDLLTDHDTPPASGYSTEGEREFDPLLVLPSLASCSTVKSLETFVRNSNNRSLYPELTTIAESILTCGQLYQFLELFAADRERIICRARTLMNARPGTLSNTEYWTRKMETFILVARGAQIYQSGPHQDEMIPGYDMSKKYQLYHSGGAHKNAYAMFDIYNRNVEQVALDQYRLGIPLTEEEAEEVEQLWEYVNRYISLAKTIPYTDVEEDDDFVLALDGWKPVSSLARRYLPIMTAYRKQEMISGSWQGISSLPIGPLGDLKKYDKNKGLQIHYYRDWLIRKFAAIEDAKKSGFRLDLTVWRKANPHPKWIWPNMHQTFKEVKKSIVEKYSLDEVPGARLFDKKHGANNNVKHAVENTYTQLRQILTKYHQAQSFDSRMARIRRFRNSLSNGIKVIISIAKIPPPPPGIPYLRSIDELMEETFLQLEALYFEEPQSTLCAQILKIYADALASLDGVAPDLPESSGACSSIPLHCFSTIAHETLVQFSTIMRGAGGEEMFQGAMGVLDNILFSAHEHHRDRAFKLAEIAKARLNTHHLAHNPVDSTFLDEVLRDLIANLWTYVGVAQADTGDEVNVHENGVDSKFTTEPEQEHVSNMTADPEVEQLEAPWTVNEYMAKEVLYNTYSWSPSTVVNTPIIDFALPNFQKGPHKTQILLSQMFRTKMKIRFTMNSNVFSSGLLVIAACPVVGATTNEFDDADYSLFVAKALSVPTRVLMDASQEESQTLELDWMWPNSSAFTSKVTPLWRIIGIVVSPLKFATSCTGTNLTIQAHVSYPECKLFIPQCQTLDAIKESGEEPLVYGQHTRYWKVVDGQEVEMEVPATEEEVTITDDNCEAQIGDGLNPGADLVVGLGERELIPHNEIIGPNSFNLKDLLSYPQYLATTSWSCNQAAGTVLRVLNVSPGFGMKLDGSVNFINWLQVAASDSLFWRGLIDFTFRAVCSRRHAGKFGVSFTTTNSGEPTMEQLTTWPNIQCSIGADGQAREVKMTPDWIGPSVYKSCGGDPTGLGTCSGYLYIWVVQPLVSLTGVAESIDIVTFVNENSLDFHTLNSWGAVAQGDDGPSHPNASVSGQTGWNDTAQSVSSGLATVGTAIAQIGAKRLGQQAAELGKPLCLDIVDFLERPELIYSARKDNINSDEALVVTLTAGSFGSRQNKWLRSAAMTTLRVRLTSLLGCNPATTVTTVYEPAWSSIKSKTKELLVSSFGGRVTTLGAFQSTVQVDIPLIRPQTALITAPMTDTDPNEPCSAIGNVYFFFTGIYPGAGTQAVFTVASDIYVSAIEPQLFGICPIPVITKPDTKLQKAATIMRKLQQSATARLVTERERKWVESLKANASMYSKAQAAIAKEDARRVANVTSNAQGSGVQADQPPVDPVKEPESNAYKPEEVEGVTYYKTRADYELAIQEYRDERRRYMENYVREWQARSDESGESLRARKKEYIDSSVVTFVSNWRMYNKPPAGEAQGMWDLGPKMEKMCDKVSNVTDSIDEIVAYIKRKVNGFGDSAKTILSIERIIQVAVVMYNIFTGEGWLSKTLNITNLLLTCGLTVDMARSWICDCRQEQSEQTDAQGDEDDADTLGFFQRLMGKLVAFVGFGKNLSRANLWKMVKTVEETLKPFGFIARGVAGVEYITSRIVIFIKAVVNYCLYKDPTGEAMNVTLNPIAVKHWTETVEFYESPIGKEVLCVSPSEMENLQHLEDFGTVFFKLAFAQQERQKTLGAPALNFIASYNKKIRTIKSTYAAAKLSGQERFETINVCLFGAPGGGKSTIMKPLMDRIMTDRGLPYGNRMFYHNPALPQWDGYMGQPGVIMDEYMTIVDQEGEQPGLLLKVVNSTPFQVDCDQADKKETWFRAKLLGTTTNNPYPVQLPCVTDRTAWLRRRFVMVEVTGKASEGTDRYTIKRSDKNEVETEEGVPIPMMTRSEMLDWVSKTVNKEWDRREKMLEKLIGKQMVKVPKFTATGTNLITKELINLLEKAEIPKEEPTPGTSKVGEDMAKLKGEAQGDDFLDAETGRAVVNGIDLSAPFTETELAILSSYGKQTKDDKIKRKFIVVPLENDRAQLYVKRESLEERGLNPDCEHVHFQQNTVYKAEKRTLLVEQSGRTPRYAICDVPTMPAISNDDLNAFYQALEVGLLEVEWRRSEVVMSKSTAMMKIAYQMKSYWSTLKKQVQTFWGSTKGKLIGCVVVAGMAVAFASRIGEVLKKGVAGVMSFFPGTSEKINAATHRAAERLFVSTGGYDNKYHKFVADITGGWKPKDYRPCPSNQRMAMKPTCCGDQYQLIPNEWADLDQTEINKRCAALVEEFRARIEYEAQLIPSGDSVTAKGHIPKVIREGVAQTLTNNSMDVVDHKIVPNLCRLSYQGTERASTMNAFGVVGHWLLTPKHFWYAIDEGTEISIERRGLTKTFSFTRSSLRVFPTYDLSLYRLPSDQDAFPDNRKHFVSDKYLKQRTTFQGALIRKVHGQNISQMNLRARLYSSLTYSLPTRDIYGAKEAQYLAQAYGYIAPTVKGDCGSVLIAHTTQPAPIMGVHVALVGGDGMGYATIVTREMLDEMIGSEPLGVIQARPKTKIIGEAQCCTIIPQGDYTILGAVPNKESYALPMKTNIERSLLFDTVEPHTTEPAVFSNRDPRLDKDLGYTPLSLSLTKFGKELKAFPKEDVDYAFSVMKAKLAKFEKLRPEVGRLTVDEVLNGVEGDISGYYTKLDMATAEGHPYKQRRPAGTRGKEWMFVMDENSKWHIRDPELIGNLAKREKAAKLGKRIWSIWLDCFKDERRPIEKVRLGKTRLFTIGPVDFTILVKQYFGDFAASFYANHNRTFTAVGIDPESHEWSSLYYYLAEFAAKVLDGDFSCYDGSLHAELLMRSADLITDWYGDGEYIVRRTLIHELVHTVQQILNTAYMTHQGHPSGHPLTVILNTIIHIILMILAWIGIARQNRGDQECPMRTTNFDEFVRPVAYGDDGIPATKDEVIPWFNRVTVSKYLKQFGVTYTGTDKKEVSTPYTNLDEASFLKRGFRKCEFNWAIHAPIDTQVIWELTNWIRHYPDPDEAMMMNIENGARFAFAHGRTFYDEYVRRVNQELQKHLTDHPSVKLLPEGAYSFLHMDFIG